MMGRYKWKMFGTMYNSIIDYHFNAQCHEDGHNYIGNTASRTSVLLNPFSTNVPLPYPMKTSENRRFSDVFRGYKSGILIKNGLSMCNYFVDTRHVMVTYPY